MSDPRDVVSRIAHDSLLQQPSLMPQREWWDRLEPDFARRRERFGLQLSDRWRVEATALLDVAVRTTAAAAVGGLAMPLGYHPWELRHLDADESLYRRAAEARDPRLLFAAPPREVAVTEHRPGLGHFKPDGGYCRDLTFQSPFVPVNPRLHGLWRRRRRNNRAHARYWRHADGPRPTIMAIHGFGAEAYSLNQWLFEVPTFYKMGYDVLLFTLPFHGPRQARLSPFSGHGFFSRGIAGINEAFCQAVYDFRIFLNHLQRVRGVSEVGVTGISLGGYTSALLAAVEPRLAFAIPNVPVASLPDLVLEWRPISAAVHLVLDQMNANIHRARRLLASVCPLSYAPVLPKERLMVIGGVGDRMAPPKHARLLWDHWGRCRIHWFPGSHLIHLDRGEYVREMAKFFKDIRF